MSFKKPCILLATIFLAACASKQEVAPLAPLGNPVPVATVWTKHINASTKVDFTKFVPVVADEQVFTSDVKGNVGSVQLTSGKDTWRINLGRAASAGVAVGSGAVYVPSVDGQLYALNENNGQTLWHVNLPNLANTAPTYSSGQLYVKTLDDKLLALNPKNGQVNWTYDEGATQLQLLGSSRAVVSGKTVIAGFSDGKLNAINTSNGLLLWQVTLATPSGFTDLGQLVGIYADPVIVGGTVFAATYQGTMSSVDLASGHVNWQRNFSTYAGMISAGGTLFASTASGNIYALSQQDGSVLWKQTALNGRQLSGLAAYDSKLIVGDNQGDLHWLSEQDGHFIARTSLGKSPITVTPVVDSGKVIAVTQNGNLFVLRLSA